MLTHCSWREKQTESVCPKKLIMMTNVKIKGISSCADRLASKTFVDKIKHKDELKVIVTQFLIG